MVYMSETAKCGWSAYIIKFFISWKNPKKSEKNPKNIKKLPWMAEVPENTKSMQKIPKKI